jgi:hypothetical protein
MFQLREPDEVPQTQAPDPAEHAARLVRQPASTARRIIRGDLVNALDHKRHTPNWIQFAWQLEAGLPVQVDYREPGGETKRLRISHPKLDRDTIDVWCAPDGDYRRLKLSRITPVDLHIDTW